MIKNEQASLPQWRKIQGEKEVRGEIWKEKGRLYLWGSGWESQERKSQA